MMSGSFTLPLVGASLLMAVAGGIQLGQSTIGNINPIHFQGAAIHPRDRGAAIEAHELRPVQPSFASLYGWDEGEAALLEDCGDCEALEARDLDAPRYVEVEPVRIYRGVEETWEEPVLYEESAAQVYLGEREDKRAAEIRGRIERYAYYDAEAIEPAPNDSFDGE